MTDFTFTPAVKEAGYIRLLMKGPAGSGKTVSALAIAQGLGSRVAVIDTQRGSAAKYADTFAFDHVRVARFDPRDLISALSAAATAGYDVLIIDSLSHYWTGPGGILDLVDSAGRQASGTASAGWSTVRPLERACLDALLAYPGHLIVTLRTKTDWVISEDARRKKVPLPVGLRPEQRAGLDYEFDIVGHLDDEHALTITKSCMGDLDHAVVARPGPELGAQIHAWVRSGVQLPTVADYLARLDTASSAQDVRALWREVTARQLGAAPCTDASGAPASLAQLISRRGALLAHRETPEPVVSVEEFVTRVRQDNRALADDAAVMANLRDAIEEASSREELASLAVGLAAVSTTLPAPCLDALDAEWERRRVQLSENFEHDRADAARDGAREMVRR